MNTARRILGVVFLSTLLSACSTVDNGPRLSYHLESKTPEAASKDFEVEWGYRQGKRPTLGLALSGGGTKAGIFAHGILQGLHDTKVLDQVDIISSTSGGGYAAYWYFSKLMEAERTHFDPELIFADCFPMWWDDTEKLLKNPKLSDSERHEALTLQAVFVAADKSAKDQIPPKDVCIDSSHTLESQPGDPYRFQAHLLRWPDMMGTKITTVTGGHQGYAKTDLMKQFGNVVMELGIGWMGAGSRVPDAYQEGIERTWGLTPKKRDFKLAQNPDIDEVKKWAYTNDKPSTRNEGSIHVDPTLNRWEQLQALYKSAKPPPYWILNSTQGDKQDAPDLNNLFELTPFSHGSLRYGWVTKPPPYPLDTISTSVRAAAAFADSQGISAGFLHNLVAAGAHIIPAARWGVDTVFVDNEGQSHPVHLSDGGGADDLGLVSLVRRGLTDIIVSDSAQDDKGVMDDLCWSKIALRGQGLFMTFPQLEGFDKACEAYFPNERDKHASVKLPHYNVSDWMNPVLHGTVKWGTTGKVTNIWLIKAAWNQLQVSDAFNRKVDGKPAIECGPHANQINCFLLAFYGHDKSSTASHHDDDWMEFPQHGTVFSTADGNSSYLTLAYRELGRMLASRIQSEDLGGGVKKISIIEDPHCKQHAYQMEYGGRPGPSLNELTKVHSTCEKADE